MKLKMSIFSILATISLVVTLIMANIDWTIATVSSTPVGRIIFVENDSQITAGKLLYSDDTLQPKSGANIVALCYASGDIWNVPSGNVLRVSDRCQPVSQKIECTKDGCYGDGGRSPLTNPNTPRIISPYDTALLNDKPSLSWFTIQATNNYNLSLTDVTGLEPKQETSVNNPSKTAEGEIRIDYPFERPLQPGSRYKLLVEGKIESAGNRAAPGEARFKMLSREEIDRVRDIVDKINKLNLPTEQKILLDLSSVYSAKHLVYEMREILEQMAKDGNQTPQIYRSLGDIYSKQGLLDLAKRRYEQAVNLATAQRDNNELEAARSALERVNDVLK